MHAKRLLKCIDVNAYNTLLRQYKKEEKNIIKHITLEHGEEKYLFITIQIKHKGFTFKYNN